MSDTSKVIVHFFKDSNKRSIIKVDESLMASCQHIRNDNFAVHETSQIDAHCSLATLTRTRCYASSDMLLRHRLFSTNLDNSMFSNHTLWDIKIRSYFVRVGMHKLMYIIQFNRYWLIAFILTCALKIRSLS